MGLQKLSSTDAFVVVDLDGAEHADGVVRCAKKVLQDGARTMARSRSYAWALLGRQVSGASAGINADADTRVERIAAFGSEMRDDVAAGSVSFDAAKGIAADELAVLAEVDTRSPLRHGMGEDLLCTGIVAAADVALGGISGATVAVDGAGPAAAALAAAFGDIGADVVATGDGADVLGAAADLLVCGSRLGLVDHDVADSLPQRAIIPCGPAPVTAKGLAVAARRGIVVMADFLTTLGPLLAFRPEPDATPDSLRAAAEQTVRELATEALAHPEGPYLGAAYRAEAFLRTWQDALPFGRPLA